MAPFQGTDTSRSNQNIALLIETCKSISQIAKILQSRETSSGLKYFYGHLVSHCAFFLDQVDRLIFEAGPGKHFVDQILDLFESLVSNQVVSHESSHVNDYNKQRALNKRWYEVRNQENDDKLRFLDGCLNVVRAPRVRPGQVLDKKFDAWAERILTEYPDDNPHWSSESRHDTSYFMCTTAQSVFEALTNSTNCGCTPRHELSASLRLSTYHILDTEDHINFDMFLSLKEAWQETRVYTARQRIVQFAVEGRSSSPQRKKQKANKAAQLVDELCKQVEEKLGSSERLDLQVEGHVVFKKLPARGDLEFDRANPAVSLKEFIARGSLTEKTKRILAVLLSYGILHLHGTSWLHAAWNSSQVLFFRKLSSKVPLRPFIHTQLGNERTDSESSNEATTGQLKNEKFNDIAHPFPSLVALASILIEVCLNKPFEKIAEDHRISPLEQPNSRIRFFDVLFVFDAVKADDIPENSQFYIAIDNCLSTETWVDEGGDPINGETLRIAIYQQIVKPLEDGLCAAFTSIAIEKLDQMVEMMDISRWGENIQNAKIKGAPLGTSSHTTNGQRLQQHQYAVNSEATIHDAIAIARKQHPKTSPIPFPGSERNFAQDFRSDSSTFYDDEYSLGNHSRAELRSYFTWRTNHKRVYRTYVEPNLQETTKPAVKIAVLDTGVDESHRSLRGGQIKAKHNWMPPGLESETPDRDGHGTFITSLLIDYAPDAELFVSKIADTKPTSPRIIAQAIIMAVDIWNVDIISMSFGYPTNQIDGYRELEDAILYAYSKNVLMFAAASNSGANSDRAYPARDTHVICVHSTDSMGNSSKFSPTALTNEINVATIGEAVESAWPLSLCDVKNNPKCVMVRSGTSIATPIVSGIAALLLQYARIHLVDVADMLKRQSTMKALLKKISEKTQSSKARNGYHYISLSLKPDNLFGKPKSFIDHTLTEILKG